jgi:excisionase family DNA binding protein
MPAPIAPIASPPAPPIIVRDEQAPLAVTVREARRMVGLGTTAIYKLMSEGKLEKVKIGGKTLIPRESLVRLIEAGRAGR